MDERLDHVAEGVLTVESETVTDANEPAERLLERPVETIVGTRLASLFPRSFDDPVTAVFAGEETEAYFPTIDRWLAIRGVSNGDERWLYLREITDRRRLERTLSDRSGELTRLTRLTEISHVVLSELVSATTRADVEQAICDHLGATDLYAFTWIGDRDPADGRLSMRADAGGTDRPFDRVRDALADATAGPEWTTAETGDPQVVGQLASDDRVPEVVRRAAFAQGLQSCLAVPLCYGTTIYGVLAVYADRPDAFSARERTHFEALGTVAGFAINAVRQRTLLLSDTVVELTVSVTDGAALSTASERFDCSLTVEGVVPERDGALLCYVTVTDATPEDCRTLLGDAASVARSRVVRDDGETGLLEVELTGGSPLVAVAELGGTVRTATFEGGSGRLVAEIAPDEDLRRVTETLVEGRDGVDLVAKRERDRPVETAQSFRSDLDEALTDRQRTVLKTAFLADYFESPRESSAAEVAEPLGITASTVLYHLRAAQRKLLSAYVRPEDDRP